MASESMEKYAGPNSEVKMRKVLLIVSTMLVAVILFISFMCFAGKINPDKARFVSLFVSICAVGLWGVFIYTLYMRDYTGAQKQEKEKNNTDEIKEAADALLKVVSEVHTSLARTSTDAQKFEKEMASHQESIQKAGTAGELKKGIGFVISEIKNVIDTNSRLRGDLDATNSRLNEQHVILEKLRIETLKDPLTRLYNRKALEDFLTQTHRKMKEKGIPVSVLMFDIDRFKNINDNYSHSEGDLVLKKIARIIHNAARENGFTARYGGEEFCVILENTNLRQAYETGEKIRLEIEKTPVHTKKETIDVRISGGVAAMHSSETPHETVKRADRALYAAKNEGRNRVRVDVEEK